MNTAIIKAIRTALDEAVLVAVDAAVKEAQAKVEKAIRARSAQIAIDVSNFYTIETFSDKVVITVRHLPVNPPTP